ncbi:MAG: ATP-dependent RecD-like DNA helicase [Clostridia bacterium]|nr:ATP-dependent RecD-like DNA helicase [Clostridia bacterium]
MEKEFIEGEVREIVYYNDDNCYCVFDLDFGKNLITCVGHIPYLTAGERVRLEGYWTSHVDYGEQFKFDNFIRTIPHKVNAIRTYLASGVIPGIREATAIKMTDLFGEETLEVIRNAPEKLTAIKGISHAKAMKMNEAFLIRQDAANTVMYFQQFGVSAKMAVKIHKKFGSLAVDLIKGNPYTLCDEISGIGFKTADRIAFQMGVAATHPGRIKSGIRHALGEAAQNGHTCYPKEKLIPYCCSLLGCDKVEIESGFSDLVLSGRIVYEKTTDYCYLTPLYNEELSVATHLLSMVGKKQKKHRFNVEAAIEECRGDIILSDKQYEAVKRACEENILIITGGPGTGKTTIINTILKIASCAGLSVSLAAPTGKAAKRLSEACQTEAKTLHRLLGLDVISENDEYTYTVDCDSPLTSDIVIVDEMSMVDLSLMSVLLKSLKNDAKLILAGDADQLPSVGAGNVLKDIISSGKFPVITLTEVFRQAQQSMIVTNAHRINSGEMPLCNIKEKDFFFMPRSSADAPATIADLCAKRLPASYSYNPLRDIQVLCPSRKGTTGTIALNATLQQYLNPPCKGKAEKKYGDTIFRTGDKVMQVKNNYNIPYTKGDTEGLGIYNGDIGIICDIDTKRSSMTVEFDDERLVEYDFAWLDELELAYALTVHKSQGCEFKAVILSVAPVAPMLCVRNLLYTAVTRAREIVVLVGNDETVFKMVSNNHVTKRYSGLPQKLSKD